MKLLLFLFHSDSCIPMESLGVSPFTDFQFLIVVLYVMDEFSLIPNTLKDIWDENKTKQNNTKIPDLYKRKEVEWWKQSH